MRVSRFGRPPAGYRYLRPHPWLFRQGFVATIAFLTPIFAALYFLTIPDGPWGVVLATQVVASLVFAAACTSYFALGVWVDRRGIAERGFFGAMITLPVDEIGSVVLVHTYQNGGSDSVPQLFVCDHDGTQVIRLRGQFWSLAVMREICAEMDVAITELGESVTPRELLAQYPGLLYWFERRPVLAAAVFSASVLVGGSVLYLGLAAIGVT